MPSRKTMLNKKCENCWKEFYTFWTNVKFCSVKCKEYKIRNKICLVCWKEYTTRSRQQKYCSESCKKEWQVLEYKKTCQEKYWVDNISQVEWNRKKAKDTIIKRYWPEWLSSDEIRKRKVESNLKKYWETSPMKVYNIKNKAINTMNEKYWWVWMWSDIIREKIIDTNKKRYWVKYQIQTKKSKKWTKIISSVNLLWMNILKDYNPISEFVLWKYSYDIRIWNILIDINPFPYHNVTWHPYWKQIGKDYHYKRTVNAMEKWYMCIHVFDWDNPSKIISLLNQSNEINIDFDKCECKKISNKDWLKFINKFYIYDIDDDWLIYYWLYNNNNLIFVMSFKNIDTNIRKILHICSYNNFHIEWWSNKIFNTFINDNNPQEVIWYCDMSKFNWSEYISMWFELENRWDPMCHKRHIWKNKYVDIYDCWHATYVRQKT